MVEHFEVDVRFEDEARLAVLTQPCQRLLLRQNPRSANHILPAACR